MPPEYPGSPGSQDTEPPRQNGRSGPPSRSALGLLTLALRRRRLLVGLPLAVMVLAAALSLVMPAEHTATSRLVPEADTDMPGNLSGMAAEVGLLMGGPGQAESLDFYSQVLQSHELLSAVALHEYEVPVEEGRDTLRGDLIALYDIEGDTPKDRLNAAVRRLERHDLDPTLDRAANVLVLRVSAPWPELAERINRQVLTLVNRFNLERRQSRAAQEEAFLEKRVAETEAELRAAESALEAFVRTNRRYSESPETAFEYGRLQRRVDFVQQVYGSMIQNLEQARVDAVRNIPVVTVLDRPEGTAHQTAPRPLVNALLGLLLGGALALSIVIAGELIRSARHAHPGDFTELETATRETLDGLRPMRRLRQIRPAPAGSGEDDG